MSRRRVQVSPPREQAGFIEMPENFGAFDHIRVEVAKVEVLAAETKKLLNQILYAVETQPQDDRWDTMLPALEEAAQDFGRFFRSAGRALAFLSPERIEEEPEA